LKVLIFAFLLSLVCLATAVASEPVYESNGVSLVYNQKDDVYEVYKDGKLDSKRMIQEYTDIAKMTKLIQELGGNLTEELPLMLNNNLMKTLKAPSEKQLVEVGTKNLEAIQSIATLPSGSAVSCPVRSEGPMNKLFSSPKDSGKKQKGWFCAAPSEKELSLDYDAKKEADVAREKRTFMNHWLGKNRRRSITTDTYNDNFLHGGKIALTGKQTADDRARTYGHALQYDEEGDEGSFSIRYSSNLFSREAPQEGKFGYKYYRDEDGKKYIEAMEETTLTLRGTKNFQDDKRLYGVGSLSFRERTDDDRGSQSIQDYWHEISGSVRYNYLEHMDDEYSLEAKAGVGFKTEGDLGKWRCRATVEALAGVDLWTMDRGELEINASVGLDSGSWGGREKDNPWLALDAYTSQTIDTEGVYESMYGAKVSTSFKWGKSKVQPYMGVEYYDQESDRMFQTGTEGNELIHTIGVKVSF
tara:strand:+ start:118973 stop:120385 length:1413 start_codon:yes stop_codon:yes gene_type:complete